ncbi:MAG: GDYXXLXY domain-containing protein [Polyangia bacterium]
MTSRRPELVRFAIALLLPLVVLVLLIGRGEYISRSGQKWRVRISGYDPRDLVHGHYLRYRLNWTWNTSEPSERDSDAVFCLNREGDKRAIPEPTVDLVPRSRRSSCRSWFPHQTEADLRRFYIPEDKGQAFERAVRDETCFIVLAVSPTGQVVVEDLLINDSSWRSVLRD